MVLNVHTEAIRLIRDGEKGKGEIIYLSRLHCHHQNDFCIKMGSDEGQSHKQCPQTTTFEGKGQPKRIRTKVPLFTARPNRLTTAAILCPAVYIFTSVHDVSHRESSECVANLSNTSQTLSSSKVVVCGHCLVTLSGLTINETLKWLLSQLILMQESFWW